MVTWTESSPGSTFLCLVGWWLGAAWCYGSCPKRSNRNELLGVIIAAAIFLLHLRVRENFAYRIEEGKKGL